MGFDIRNKDKQQPRNYFAQLPNYYVNVSAHEQYEMIFTPL